MYRFHLKWHSIYSADSAESTWKFEKFVNSPFKGKTLYFSSFVQTVAQSYRKEFAAVAEMKPI